MDSMPLRMEAKETFSMVFTRFCGFLEGLSAENFPYQRNGRFDY